MGFMKRYKVKNKNIIKLKKYINNKLKKNGDINWKFNK